ncbi:putative sporulation protein YtxC [Evansella caseinilytica]|uniref:Putative sporulation protein YtxC n=1 Tax=Evansella caseinilytica TaxID=1503961 RepID=A0A1H3TWN2_9BACI|nr:putative sporulation protein YtxC [Evansella caseinilytica]
MHARNSQLDLHDWEGLPLLTIQFKDFAFGHTFYEQFQHSTATYGGEQNTIEIEKAEEYTNVIIYLSEIRGEEGDKRKQIASLLTNVTIKHMFPIWLTEWLRNDFHYKDPYEIDAIIEHARDIFFNMKRNIPLSISFFEWQKGMFRHYEQFIRDAVNFSIDSFLRFRLREIREELMEVVEKAIDEYKYEHDYQIMVQTCREFLQKNNPRIHTVHLYLDYEFKFVDEKGRQVSQQDIRRWLVHDLCFEAPLPITERVVGPLVSIAPKKLIIHTRQHHDGLIQTLLSVFEERVELVEESTAGKQ